jgi:hypothetical protein
MSRKISFSLALVAAVLLAAALPAKAEDYSNIRIVRLSFVEGEVQYRRAGQEWQTAGINLPIQKGFDLQTGSGFAEVEFENGLAVRLANNTLLNFTELALVDGHRVTHLTMGSGTVIVSANLGKLDELTIATTKSVATSPFALRVPRSGRFRLDVSATESWVTLFRGRVDFESETGVISLTGHQSVHAGGEGSSEPQIVRSPAPDAFDKWVSQREDAQETAQRGTADYLQSKFYSTGFADLYNYGTWMDLPGYGFGWQPWGMGPGWMPFLDGCWSFMPITGWNWMSNEPWGWMPYHFGNWIDVAGAGWIWVPGPGRYLNWQPANATWVRVNGQTGWTPNAPPILSGKTPKGMPRTLAPVVVVAGQGGGGVITPGGRVHVGTLVGIQSGVTPAQTFTAIGRLPLSGVNHGSGPAKSGMSSPANPGLQGRDLNGNVSTGARAPVTSNAALRQGAPTNVPPAMQAPRAMPAPPVARGAGPVGFGGGGIKGGGGGGVDASRGTSGSGGGNGGVGSAGGSVAHGATGPSGGGGGGASGAGASSGGGGSKGGGRG